MTPQTTMDFFAREEGAERASRRLAWLFALAVLATLVSINLAVAYGCDFWLAHQDAFGAVRHRPYPAPGDGAAAGDQQRMLRIEVHLGVTLVTLAIIALGSIWKISELSAGGKVVASMLGGRLLSRTPGDARERMLVNVVEEMSIASGVPMPEVFVLDHEQGINAFAAGHQPGDAVVAVTRGALEQLGREELQGVIGHEFSHILHGDMRLNLRLMGLVHGILVIGLTGALLIRLGGSVRSDANGRNPVALLFVIGIAAYIIGYIGFFFGGLIKSAISRQREYLADASSVQFTRNPHGLASALKRLGAGYQDAHIAHHSAHEASHFFFGNGVGVSWLGLLETHPPLEERIRAIEPQWDGSYPPPAPPLSASDPVQPPEQRQRQQIATLAPHELVARIGTVSPEHVAFGALLLASIPGELQQAAKEPYSARALALCLLLDGDRGRAEGGLAAIGAGDPDLARDVSRLLPAVAARGAGAHLPILDLCLPSLRQLSAGQRDAFLVQVSRIQSAAGAGMGSYCIATLLRTRLVDQQQGASGSGAVQSVQPLWPQLRVLLSALARAGVAAGASAPGGDEQEAVTAFRAAAGRLVPDGAAADLLSAGECGDGPLDAALVAIAKAAPGVKRRIVSACAWCVAADGVVTVAEAELLRVVCSCLGCPMPPFAAPP